MGRPGAPQPQVPRRGFRGRDFALTRFVRNAITLWPRRPSHSLPTRTIQQVRGRALGWPGAVVSHSPFEHRGTANACAVHLFPAFRALLIFL